MAIHLLDNLITVDEVRKADEVRMPAMHAWAAGVGTVFGFLVQAGLTADTGGGGGCTGLILPFRPLNSHNVRYIF